MTCREFKHNAAALSLLQLAQTEEAQILGHAETCPACESWLQKQRSLAASLHALQVRTASLDAGPDVERALLGVFRQGISAGIGASPANAAIAFGGTDLAAGMKEQSKTIRPIAAPVSTPFALRLSRIFEIGAYAAVAAAIAIAIFLGVHLLQRGSRSAPVQSQSAPQKSAPETQQPVTVASGSETAATSVSSSRIVPLQGRREGLSARRRRSLPVSENGETTVAQANTDEPQSDSEAGYTALMFCDPLSCSTDSQVVRMELPGSDGAQPQTADVVVGYDGVVRAVRFVN